MLTKESEASGRVPQLGEGQQVLFVSEPVALREGISHSSKGNEFLHFAFYCTHLLAALPDQYNLDNLASILTITSTRGSNKFFVWAVPSAFSLFMHVPDRLYVRINTFDLLQRSMPLFGDEGDVLIKLIIVRRIGLRIGSSDIRKRVTGKTVTGKNLARRKSIILRRT